MPYAVVFKPSADKALRKLQVSVQRQIVAAADDLADDPRPAGSLELQGAEDLWRIRIGSYRVVYTIQDEALIVLVVRVAHRKDIYRSYSLTRSQRIAYFGK